MADPAVSLINGILVPAACRAPELSLRQALQGRGVQHEGKAWTPTPGVGRSWLE